MCVEKKKVLNKLVVTYKDHVKINTLIVKLALELYLSISSYIYAIIGIKMSYLPRLRLQLPDAWKQKVYFNVFTKANM